MQGDIQSLGIRLWVSLPSRQAQWATVGHRDQCDLLLAVIPFCLILLLTAGKEKGAERVEILLIVWGFNSLLNE